MVSSRLSTRDRRVDVSMLCWRVKLKLLAQARGVGVEVVDVEIIWQRKSRELEAVW